MKRRIRHLPILLIPLFCIFLVFYLHHRSPAQVIPAGTQAQQLEWLAAQGIEAQQALTQEITVPVDFSGNYADYAALQELQQLPLRKYAGKSALCATYRIENGAQPMYAELLIADGILIGAQCYTPEGGQTLDLRGEPFTLKAAEPA